MKTSCDTASGTARKGEDDMIALLLDFRWVKRQLAINGFVSLIADYTMLSTAISDCGPSGDCADGGAVVCTSSSSGSNAQ
jgi:hypothetical protein